MGENSKNILKGVNEKNKNSWEILYDHYYAALCSYVERFVGDSDQAKDLVQEVFIGLWKSEQQFADIKNLTYYLYKSCYHRSLNFIRNQKLKNEKVELIGDKSHFESDEIYQETLQEEVVRVLYYHINELPTQQKEILLWRLKGYKWMEIAEELNISINTIKTYRNRAFKSLSSKMNVTELFILVLFFSMKIIYYTEY